MMQTPSTLFVTGMLLGVWLGLMDGSAQAGQERTMMAVKSPSLYDFTLNDIDGKPVNLSHYRGTVLLLVNTASLCGNTPQYSELQAMYEQYHDKGFEILAFPANNFGQQ